MSGARYVFTCKRDEFGWTTYISMRDPEENDAFVRGVERLNELLRERWING